MEEVSASWPLLNQFFTEKGDVKNAFRQGTFDDVPLGELAAEAVPELREALNLRDDEVVALMGACRGLIDAPRRWRKSFAWDTQQLGLAQLPTRAMSDDLACSWQTHGTCVAFTLMVS